MLQGLFFRLEMGISYLYTFDKPISLLDCRLIIEIYLKDRYRSMILAFQTPISVQKNVQNQRLKHLFLIWRELQNIGKAILPMN